VDGRSKQRNELDWGDDELGFEFAARRETVMSCWWKFCGEGKGKWRKFLRILINF
jgi:hypothetical protein